MIYSLLYNVLDSFFQFLYVILTIRVILSFFSHNPYHPVIKFIYQMTEPILSPFRSMINTPGIDFSPLFAFIAIGIIRRLIFQLLF